MILLPNALQDFHWRKSITTTLYATERTAEQAGTCQPGEETT